LDIIQEKNDKNNIKNQDIELLDKFIEKNYHDIKKKKVIKQLSKTT